MIKECVIWVFNQISNLTEVALSWKLIGDFSLLHFILGFNFIIILFAFYKLGMDSTSEIVGSDIRRFGNDENRKDKLYFKVQGYEPRHAKSYYRPRHRKD